MALVLLVLPAPARTEPAAPVADAGRTYRITVMRDRSEQGDLGSSGESHDRDVLVERVLREGPDGSELEYDVPTSRADAGADDWQFPVRVFRPASGPLRLLNDAELEARVDAWLERAKLTRAACGHWYFTWNAFQVECDPRSVLDTLKAVDLRVPDLRDGGFYGDADALGAVPLTREPAGPGGATYRAELILDPDGIRRTLARSDAVVAEILHNGSTLETALATRKKEEIAGTISVTIDVDAAGTVWRRTRVTRYTVKDTGGRSETDTVSEVVERHAI